MRARIAAAALLAAFVAAGVPNLADAGSTGTVTSRLTLRGPVSSADIFIAHRSSSVPGAIIEPGVLVCGPPTVAASECAAGTYEVETPPLPVGSTVQYEFRRYAGAAANFSRFCQGSITVQERQQVVTCVYDYSGVSAPLPDAAIERVHVIPTPSLAGLVLVGTAAIWYVASRYRRNRTS